MKYDLASRLEAARTGVSIDVVQRTQNTAHGHKGG